MLRRNGEGVVLGGVRGDGQGVCACVWGCAGRVGKVGAGVCEDGDWLGCASGKGGIRADPEGLGFRVWEEGFKRYRQGLKS